MVPLWEQGKGVCFSFLDLFLDHKTPFSEFNCQIQGPNKGCSWKSIPSPWSQLYQSGWPWFFCCNKQPPTFQRLKLRRFMSNSCWMASSGLCSATSPASGHRLTEGPLFGMSPDSQRNEKNRENGKVAFKYFCPKAAHITSAHLARPDLISRWGSVPPPLCPEWALPKRLWLPSLDRFTTLVLIY